MTSRTVIIAGPPGGRRLDRDQAIDRAVNILAMGLSSKDPMAIAELRVFAEDLLIKYG